MKLAEALLERKALNDQIASLTTRMQTNAIVQEGDRPSEPPDALASDFDKALDQFEAIVKRINATNNVATLPDGTTVSEAIVRRDVLKRKREAIELVANAADQRVNRYSRSEVKFVATVNASDLRKRVDALAKEWRELDTAIQGVNWTADLI